MIWPPTPSLSRNTPSSRCSGPTCSDPRARASPQAYSTVFLARGVNGIDPTFAPPFPRPMISTTRSRTAGAVMPSSVSTCAARPSPGWRRGRCDLPRPSSRTAAPARRPRGRRTDRGNASVVSAQPAQRLLVPGQVLLEQLTELGVLPALVDERRDRLPGDVRHRAALDRGHRLQPLGQLRVEPQQDVLGCVLGHRYHDITLATSGLWAPERIERRSTEG